MGQYRSDYPLQAADIQQLLLQRLEYNLHYALDSLSASSHLLRTDRKRLNKESLYFKDLLEGLAEKYSQHPQFDLEINVEKEEG